MARKKIPRISTQAPAASGLGNLGALLEAQGLAGSGVAPPPAAPVSSASPTPTGRVVVRKERKGRGGKTVTTVSGLGLSGAELGALSRQVRKALGCGSSRDGDTLVLQGDQREAVADMLRAQGRRVSLG